MTVFLDTSALYPVFNESDRYHRQAASTWRDLVVGTARLVTTNYVTTETIALLQKRRGLEFVRTYRELAEPAIDVIWVDSGLHVQSFDEMLALGRRNVSLVDCVSFQVMRREGIRQVFTFDPHFAEAGFECLPAPAAPS